MTQHIAYLLSRIDPGDPVDPGGRGDWVPDNAWGDCVQNGIATLQCVPIVFQNVINASLMLAGATAVGFVIWSGVKMINSGGEAKQVQAARQTLTFAIVGLILILLAFFIVNVISVITGVSCITSFGFDNCK